MFFGRLPLSVDLGRRRSLARSTLIDLVVFFLPRQQRTDEERMNEWRD